VASHPYTLFTAIDELVEMPVYGRVQPPPHHGIVIFTTPPHTSFAVTPAPWKSSVVNHVPIDDHSSCTSIPPLHPDANWSAHIHCLSKSY
jgi:hypothetical protein